ncbi:MAG: hypothetical protein MJE63_26690 [Proteobacteria bacterium]|nr:hypothetical protein [Pseudomonadota bacterium]
MAGVTFPAGNIAVFPSYQQQRNIRQALVAPGGIETKVNRRISGMD